METKRLQVYLSEKGCLNLEIAKKLMIEQLKWRVRYYTLFLRVIEIMEEFFEIKNREIAIQNEYQIMLTLANKQNIYNYMLSSIINIDEKNSFLTNSYISEDEFIIVNPVTINKEIFNEQNKNEIIMHYTDLYAQSLMEEKTINLYEEVSESLNIIKPELSIFLQKFRNTKYLEDYVRKNALSIEEIEVEAEYDILDPFPEHISFNEKLFFNFIKGVDIPINFFKNNKILLTNEFLKFYNKKFNFNLNIEELINLTTQGFEGVYKDIMFILGVNLPILWRYGVTGENYKANIESNIKRKHKIKNNEIICSKILNYELPSDLKLTYDTLTNCEYDNKDIWLFYNPYKSNLKLTDYLANFDYFNSYYDCEFFAHQEFCKLLPSMEIYYILQIPNKILIYITAYYYYFEKYRIYTKPSIIKYINKEYKHPITKLPLIKIGFKDNLPIFFENTLGQILVKDEVFQDIYYDVCKHFVSNIVLLDYKECKALFISYNKNSTTNTIFFVKKGKKLFLLKICFYNTLKELNEFLIFFKIKLDTKQYAHQDFENDRINLFKLNNYLLKLSKFEYNYYKEIGILFQKSLYRLRHDHLCYLIYSSYGFKNIEEKTLKNEFKISPENSKYTPDIYFIKDSNVYIYEISVTTQPIFQRQKKFKKYEGLIHELELLNMPNKVFFDIFCFHPSLRNLQSLLITRIPNLNSQTLNLIWTLNNDVLTNILYLNNLYGTPFDESLPKPIEYIKINDSKIKSFEEKLQNSLDTGPNLDKIILNSLESVDEKYKPKQVLFDELNLMFKELIKMHDQNYLDPDIIKPSLHIVYDPRHAIFAEEKEEKLVYDFINNELNKFLNEEIDPCFAFLEVLTQRFQHLRECNICYELFHTGENSQFPKKMFKIEKQKISSMNKTSVDYINLFPKYKSYIKYIAWKLDIDIMHFRCYYHKTIKMHSPINNFKAYTWYKLAGINAKKLKGFSRKIKQGPSKSVKLKEEYVEEMDKFINEQSITMEHIQPNIYPSWLQTSKEIKDHGYVERMKEAMHKENNPILDLLSQICIFRLAHRTMLFGRELCMLGSFKGRNGHYYFFNTGLKNIHCLIAGQNMKTNSDPGVCFMFFGKLSNENVKQFGLFSRIYGQVYYKYVDEGVLFCSNWRRLKRSRLSFMADSFFSTLSTALIDLNKYPLKGLGPSYIREFYTVRVITSLNSSQKSGEMLADFKYVALSSFSIYSRLLELFKDKYNTILSCHFHVWLIFTFYKFIHHIIYAREHKLNLVQLNIPEYIDNIRNLKTIGGNIQVPMIWSNGSLFSFNHFINSVHLYVHSFKEPASMFHESIKSLKTILKFNEKYNNLTKEQRIGDSNTENLKKILTDFEIGFSNKFLYESTLSFHNKYKTNFLNILNKNKFKKPIAHFSSTRASISSFDREIDAEYRYKVHDSLILNPQVALNTLFDHTANTLNNKNFKPLADICIKEQFGAKREFYVLDIHSKYLCKTVEEFCSEWAKFIDTECISVPGDLKLNKMDKMITDIYKHAAENRNTVYFINGDCSKWSASECMESFFTMIYSLKSFIPLDAYNLIMGVILLWRKKRIQIPGCVTDSITIKSLISDYLFDDKGTVHQLKLKQNFLMGIFNYLSSIKGAIIYNAFKDYIEINYPNTRVSHLEHSDDYVIAISCKTNLIEYFKMVLTIFMRLGGITDSIKKTTVSTWYCEFVSLYSFNGHCVYPQIKKTKEISSVLSGQGFCNDSDAICSRTSEVVRVGCYLSDALIFHKLHNWLLAYNYSLLPKMNNERINLYNIPVQAFGLSEVNPLLYFINKGDPNNLRLFKYVKESLPYLMGLCLQNFQEFNNYLDEYEGVVGFKKPFFQNLTYKKRLYRVMKETNTTLADCRSFWEMYPALRYYKPHSQTLIIDYLKAFYCVKEFQLAYESQSRLNFILKMAKYVKGKCVKLKYLGEEDYITMKEAFNKIDEFVKSASHIQLKAEQLSCGDTAALIFYQLLESSKISRIDQRDVVTYNTVNVSPFYFDPIRVDTPLDILLLKKYNPILFETEKKYINPFWDVDSDLKYINELDKQFEKIPISRRIHFIYSYIQGMKKPLRCIMTPFNGRKELLEFCLLMFRDRCAAKFSFRMEQKNEIKFINPINPSLKTFYFKNKEIPYERAVTLNIIAIFTVLKFKDKLSFSSIYRYFDMLKLQDKETCIEFLHKLKFEDLPYFGFKYSEICSLIYIKSFLNLDYSDILSFMKSWHSYTHRYQKKGKLIGNKYVGDTVVEFNHFITDNKACLIDESLVSVLTNAKTISRITHIFAIGLKLLQKSERYEWNDQEINQLLHKYKMSWLEYAANKQHLIKYFGSKLTNIKVLIKDHTGYNFVVLTYQDTNAEYYPIFQDRSYFVKDRPNFFNEKYKDTIEIDNSKAALLLKPGGWVICRFGTVNLFTSPDLFENSNEFSLGGLKLTYLLKDFKLSKFLSSDLPNLSVIEFFNNVVHEELPKMEVINMPISPIREKVLYGLEFMEDTSMGLSERPSDPEVSNVLNPAMQFPEILPGLLPATTDITGTQIFKSLEDFSSFMGMDMEIDMSKFMKIDSESQSSESEPEETFKDLEFNLTDDIIEISLLPIFKQREKQFLKQESELPGFLRSLNLNTNLWEDGINIMLKGLLIEGKYLSKFAWILYAVFLTKFPNIKLNMTNTVLIILFNKIFEMMEKHPPYPEVEKFPYLFYTSRLIEDKIHILGYKSVKIPAANLKQLMNHPMFIVNNGKGPKALFNFVEKRFTKDESVLAMHKIADLLTREDLAWGNYSVDPIFYPFYRTFIPQIAPEVFIQHWV